MAIPPIEATMETSTGDLWRSTNPTPVQSPFGSRSQTSTDQPLGLRDIREDGGIERN